MILCCMFFISPSAWSWVQGKSYIMLSTREVNLPAYGGSWQLWGIWTSRVQGAVGCVLRMSSDMCTTNNKNYLVKVYFMPELHQQKALSKVPFLLTSLHHLTMLTMPPTHSFPPKLTQSLFSTIWDTWISPFSLWMLLLRTVTYIALQGAAKYSHRHCFMGIAIIVIPILQIKKRRHRKVKQPDQGYTVSDRARISTWVVWPHNLCS